MSKQEPTQCLLCRARLEPGWLLDLGDHDQRHEQQWGSGEPKRSFWLGNKKPEKSFGVRAYRCTACGFLMQFANPDDAS